MKAKHLLAALALPAIFTACSQDELPTNNVEKEVVGTPIGYDLEFKASFNNGPSTRLTPEIGWEVGDKIGMGWISATDLAASANLYSNHPIFCKDGAGKFKSETMIYEGLYIASYPFQLTQKIAPLAFDLAKQNSDSSYYSGRQHVSDKFIELTKETAGLGNSTTLKLVALTNLMKLNIKLPAKATVPEDFKITGVTLDGGTSSQLVNKLTLASDNATDVKKDGSTLATACWTPAQGNIEVNFGKDSEGKAIDATKGLDVFVQMGAFATTDATTLVLHTNYGDAEITTGTDVVSWSSPVLEVEEAKGDDFASAIQALYTGANAKTKPYGQTVLVNVILDTNKIKVPETVTNQADLDRIIDLLDKLGKLKADNTTTATIEFSKSTLKVADGVETAGDVILTDLSGLNKLGGVITFQKSGKTVGTPGVSQTPTNVYLSGELALKADPTFATTTGIVALAEFKVRKGETLTVSEDLDLGAVNLTVNAGATLINKADIVAGVVKTIAGTTKPVVKAGLYISEEGADASNISTFTNNGEVEWIAGTLKATMAGTLYANVTLSTDMKSASDAFELVTGDATNEIIIATDMTTPTQLTKTALGGIKKMTINGNVSFGVGMADAFEFSALTAIDVKSGSFNITGGNPSTAANAFYAFKTGNCDVTLATGTELNVASGAKLDLGTGTIKYTGATINNSGYIVAGGTSGTGIWNGNVVGVNPKPVKP